jgi:NitT/TauT family transport system substrate-binding protein
MIQRISTILLLTLVGFFAPSLASSALASEKISFGVLPTVQALPLFVAAERGFFSGEGLDVELVPFRSGLEKDAAMAAGRTQGYFGDMFTSIILDANQMPVRMIATVFNTTGSQRMFAVLAAPGTGKPGLGQLAREGIAGSSNTVIEYITEKLLEKAAPGTGLKLVETKDILARVPMLLGGQVPGAVLPEPLVSFAESRGATVVSDDRGLGITPTTLLFTREFIESNPDKVRAFLRATAMGAALIGTQPVTVRPIMIRHTRIPEPLQDSFPIPEFGPPSLPDEELVMDAYRWLRGRGILKKELTFEEMVRADLLPQ